MSARAKMCLAFLGAVGLLGGGAYSVYALKARASSARLPTPTIVLAPAKQTSLGTAKFRYTDSGPGVSFQCSLDGVPFKACALHPGLPGPAGRGKHVYHELSLGPHSFRVRVIGSAGGSAGAPSHAARYDWLVVAQAGSPDMDSPQSGSAQLGPAQAGPTQPGSLEPGPTPPGPAPPDPTPPGPTPPNPTPPSPEGFSISSGESAAGPLYPGAAPSAIPLTLTNPGEVAIFVTSLTVSASGGAPGCGSAENISIAQPDLSSSAPVEVPAHGSVTLPAQGHAAPTIQLVDLPVNQDACRNAHFALGFTGSAHS